MLVRPATKNDLEGMSRLLYQVAAVHHEGRPDIFRPASKKYTDSELLEILDDECRPIFLAELDGKIVGHIYCIINDMKDSSCLCDVKTLYIDDFCVDEQVRGRHIGKAMYHFVKEYAAKIGCYNITLNVWHCNEAAEKFYQKMGLTVQKTTLEEIL